MIFIKVVLLTKLIKQKEREKKSTGFYSTESGSVYANEFFTSVT